MLSILCIITGILLAIFSYSGNKKRRSSEPAGLSSEAVDHEGIGQDARDWQVDDDTKRNLLYSLWICHKFGFVCSAARQSSSWKEHIVDDTAIEQTTQEQPITEFEKPVKTASRNSVHPESVLTAAAKCRVPEKWGQAIDLPGMRSLPRSCSGGRFYAT